MSEMSNETNNNVAAGSSIGIIEHTVNIDDDDRALGDLSVYEMKDVLGDSLDDYMHNFLKKYKPEITFEESWNQGIEEVLRRRGEQAYGYSWMHHECIEYFLFRHKVMWVSGILFGVLFAGGGLTTVGLDTSKFVSMSAIAGTISSPVIAYLTGQVQYEKRAEDHRDLEGKYKNLRDLIEEELKKDLTARRDAEKFMEETRKEMNELMDPENSPNIPSTVSKRYKRFLKRSNQLGSVSLPTIAGGSGHISLRRKKKVLEV